MNEERTEQLKAIYPEMFNNKCMMFGFECGDGWFELLKDLITELKKISIEEKIDIDANQVKEKYGGLRFYLAGYSDAMEGAIERAEIRSFRTCEICGKPGEINNGRWLSVRCQECRK